MMMTAVLLTFVSVATIQAQAVADITFETGDFSQYPMMNDANHPWVIVAGGAWNSQYWIMSSNKGIPSSTSSIEATATYSNEGYIDFDAQCMGEGSHYDKCCFYIDGELQFEHGDDVGTGYKKYHFQIAAGTHSFRWVYSKDNSVDPPGDYFAVDNIRMGYGSGCRLPDCIIVETAPNSAIASWNGYSETYTLRYKPRDEFEWTYVEGLTDNSYTFTNLSEGRYDLEIKSDCMELGVWFCTTFSFDPTSVAEQTKHFALWPNPAGNTLHLEGVEGEMVRVYDNTGRMVIEQLYEGQLDLSGLVTGTYAVTAAGSTMKFVKE